MNPQIQKAAYYIETHLDAPLDLRHLAAVAGYSPYHFCRIFKLHMGESAMAYATRLKLERAGKTMLLAEKRMIEIALDAGFKTPSGFLKAFKSHFGMTPTQYKACTLSRLQRYKEISVNPPRIITREAIDAVFVRALGDYEKSSQIAWQELTDKLATLREQFETRPPGTAMQLGPERCEAIGICHDDPKVTDEAQIRYDAVLAWTSEEVHELTHYGFDVKTIAGGRYAVTDYLGESNGEATWYALYAWVEANGHTFRDAPAFEKYLNGATERDKTKRHIEVYVPIV